jgi:hypothetical protein
MYYCHVRLVPSSLSTLATVKKVTGTGKALVVSSKRTVHL